MVSVAFFEIKRCLFGQKLNENCTGLQVFVKFIAKYEIACWFLDRISFIESNLSDKKLGSVRFLGL